jgi:hypothetical protein
MPEGDVIATVETSTGDIYPLQHWKHHSDGLNYGYAGSGPADLALAILLDHFGEWPTKEQMDRGLALAWHLHQPFKFAFVARAVEAGFTVTTVEIDEWINNTWAKDHEGVVDELRKTIKEWRDAYQEGSASDDD